MNAFQFKAPTRLMISDHCAESLAEILEKERCVRLGILLDRNVAGLPRIQELIESAEQGCREVVLVEVDVREPTTDFVDGHTTRFKTDVPDLLVGIGGGSTLDLAKAVSVLAFNPEPAATYQGRDLMPNPSCTSVMVPTTAGTGAEVTPGAVVVNPETKRKGAISGSFVTPDYAILDAELTTTVPDRVAWATGVDALAHAVESFTARCATQVTKMYSREAFGMIGKSLPAILGGDAQLEIRQQQQLGATLAGAAICNSDTGACHSMAYPMGIYFEVPHGVAVGLLFPHVMAVNIRKGATSQYAELVDLLPGDTGGLSEEEKCWHLQQFVSDLEPDDVALANFGIQTEHVAELAEHGLDLKTALSNNPVDFTASDARSVLEKLV